MSYSFDPRSELPLVLGGNVFGWSADRDQSFAVLDAFVDAGGSQIDTADAYARWLPGNTGGESETIIGEWLARSGKRDRVFLATKVGALPPWNNLAPATIAEAVDNSLRRLQTDHIDLYWAHRDDENTPQEETLAAFDALVTRGQGPAPGRVQLLRGPAAVRAGHLGQAPAGRLPGGAAAVQPARDHGLGGRARAGWRWPTTWPPGRTRAWPAAS